MNPPQHMVALANANAIRFKRADLRRGLSSRETDIPSVLSEEAPDWLRSAKVGDILRMAHRVGPSKARKICYMAGVPYPRTMGELTKRQRDSLIRSYHQVCRYIADVKAAA